MDKNEKVFKSDMAVALYEAYEEFLSIPDFSGHKTIDAMNYMAEKLEKKGYRIPTTDYCILQTYHIVTGRLAKFIREHMDGTVFDEKTLTAPEKELFDNLVGAYNLLRIDKVEVVIDE